MPRKLKTIVIGVVLSTVSLTLCLMGIDEIQTTGFLMSAWKLKTAVWAIFVLVIAVRLRRAYLDYRDGSLFIDDDQWGRH